MTIGRQDTREMIAHAWARYSWPRTHDWPSLASRMLVVGCVACGGNVQLKPGDLVGRTGCVVPDADSTTTMIGVDSKVTAMGKQLVDAKLTVEQKRELIRTHLPKLDEFERLEFRLCLAHDYGRLTREEYMALIPLLVEKATDEAAGRILTALAQTDNNKTETGASPALPQPNAP